MSNVVDYTRHSTRRIGTTMRPDPHDWHPLANAGAVDPTTSTTRRPASSNRRPGPVTPEATDQQLFVVTEPSLDESGGHTRAHLTQSSRYPNRTRRDSLLDIIWAIAIVGGLILTLIVMAAILPDVGG